MINQGASDDMGAFGGPLALPGPDLPESDGDAAGARQGSPVMLARLEHLMRDSRQPRPFVLAAEQVGSVVVTLPRASARQRASMIAFAAEERIAAPIDTVLVTPGPQTAVSGGPQLAFVVDRRILNDCPADAVRILPEYLLVARPDDGSWAVWSDGARCVVRAGDGSGFAVATDMLPVLWARAGKPPVISLGQALPAGLLDTDLSDNPPTPDPAELAYGLPRARPGDSIRTWRPVIVASLVLALGLLAHLGVLAADVVALGRIAAQERATAQAAIAGPLPGLVLTSDVTPVLDRLTPAAPSNARGTLLPLVSDLALALAETDATATFRRMAWSAVDNELVLLVQATGLEALQTIEQGLTSRGFTVRSGAASAGDGGAEAEMRISRASS